MNWKKFARQLINNPMEASKPVDDQTHGEFFKTLTESEILITDEDKDLAWEEVRDATGTSRRAHRLNMIWKVAACIVVLAGVGYWLLPKGNTIKTQIAQTSTISLKDGTKVFLNQSSALSFQDDFNEETREVRLKGEAFFQVARDARKPFIIDLGDVQVTVLGTSFNVYTSPSGSAIEVIVESGKVALQSGSKSIILQSGEAGFYHKKNDALEKPDANRNHLAWRTHRFEFASAPFSEISMTIERVFKVDVILENTTLENCRITSSFEFESLSDVLEILQLTVGFEYIRSGNTIKILGDGC